MDVAADRFAYGGQAVIDGVMMRGRRAMAVAARAPSGEIVVWSEPIRASRVTARARPWPLVRGVFLLWDAMTLGVRALAFSEAVGALPRSAAGGDADLGRQTAASPHGIRLPIPVVVALAILISVGLFFVAPLLVVAGLDRFIASAFAGNLIEGVIRLGLLVGYVWGVSFLPDVRRVFAYHGAEHKTVHAWEAGSPLEVAEVRRFPLAHPRCGTGFMLVVMVVSLLLFLALGEMDLLTRLASRVVLVPLVAGVAYEVLRYGGRQTAHPVGRFLLAPGLKLQRLTTREPDDAMLEVAIVALLRVLVADGRITEGDPRLRAARGFDGAGRPLLPTRRDNLDPIAAD